MSEAGFERLGAWPPATPVIVSVPHGGRIYPLPMRAALRVPEAALLALEDRHVDTLARAAAHGETMLVQRLGRAWIDLNRAETERDPQIDEGAGAGGAPQSAKLRGGLGLVPRRSGSAQNLYRRRFTAADIGRRIEVDYRPYHATLAEALAAVRARFGVAVLLDIHSMPPLGAGEARIVLGDRFGRAAGARFVARAEWVASASHTVALNAPYAGGHILERHADPANGIHAIQLELDRTLYLDAALDQPGPGFTSTAALVARIVNALSDEVLATGWALAAE